jgi:hypothetical protein
MYDGKKYYGKKRTVLLCSVELHIFGKLCNNTTQETAYQDATQLEYNQTTSLSTTRRNQNTTQQIAYQRNVAYGSKMVVTFLASVLQKRKQQHSQEAHMREHQYIIRMSYLGNQQLSCQRINDIDSQFAPSMKSPRRTFGGSKTTGRPSLADSRSQSQPLDS